MTAARRTGRHIGLALFLFILALQCLNFSGAPHSSDGLAMLATTESLARRGDLDMNAYRWMGLQQGTFGPDGELYSRKGLGQTLAALPLAWLSLRTGAVGLLQGSLLVSPLVAAATAWLLYRCLLALGFGVGGSLAASLAMALATPLLPYGKHDFSDPLTGLALLAAFAAWLAYRRRESAWRALAVGLALGFAALTRTTSLALTPVFGLALWLGKGDGVPVPSGSKVKDAARAFRRRLPHLLAFAAGLGVLVALSGWFNYLRFGNPLTSGYLAEESFSGNWAEGILGLLIGPGRGLFLYAPVLVPALFGWRDLYRRHSDVALVAAAVALAHVLIYGKWFMWHGGYCWGPRFLAPAMPFLALGLAPIWERGRRRRLAFLSLSALGLAVNLLGSITHFAPFQDDLLAAGLPLFDPRTFWEPRYSPLLGQWRYVGLRSLDFAWAAAAGGTPRIDVPALSLLLVAVTLAAAGLRGAVAGRAGRLLVVAGLAVVCSLGFTLVRAHGDGTHPLDTLLAELQRREATGDVFVTTIPSDATPVADRYRGALPVCSLPTADESLLTDLTSRYRRLWVLEESAGSAAGSRLAGRTYPVLTVGARDRRLALYAVEHVPTVAVGAGAVFQDGIELRQTTVALQGDTLLVLLTWQSSMVPSRSYKVFVHVLDGDGAVVAQSDAVPAAWLRPTDTWSPGETVPDRHGLLLPPGVEPVSLRIGLYALDDGTPLPLQDGSRQLEVPISSGE